MTSGYMGKILYIDLSNRDILEESITEKDCHDFIGGYGLGTRIIFSRQKAKADPLGPENILGFMTGPLTGTRAPSSGRFTVVGKSPLTGTWGDANCGGNFGPYLKFSGYDAVLFSGMSEDPVYLFIDDGKVELRNAGQLWGNNTHETEEIIRAELGKDVRIACIGPSGEMMSAISSIISDKSRAAARSGLGAVMGSKKLKAIAVRGTHTVPVADKESLKEARNRQLVYMRNSPWYRAFHEVGTNEMLVASVEIGRTPVKNWNGSIYDLPNVEAIGGYDLIKKEQEKYSCWGCPIGCGGRMKEGVGEYKYPAGVSKPEYETVAAFGTMCLNESLDSIIQANYICDLYGLDTISTGCTIAFAIECYENGIITKKDTDNIELNWGNHRSIIKITEKIAKRQGFGSVLADGVKVAASRIGKGAEEYAIHIQGQELPMHDPRAQIRVGLGATYKAAPTPARHTRGSGEGEFRHPEQYPPPFDLDSLENRGEEHKNVTDIVNAISSAGLCLFGYLCMSYDAPAEFMRYVTGWDIDNDDLLFVGERIANIQQAFNIREGLNPIQFKVPSRIKETTKEYKGPNSGRYCDIGLLVKDWYAAMDWDVETGIPSKGKLHELGLKDVAATLYR